MTQAQTRHLSAMTTVARQEQYVIARSAPLTLGAYDSSPRTARASARTQLSQWGWGYLAEVTETIVSELVTNAVVASELDDTPIGLRLVLTTASVFVEVFDRAPGYPVAREPDADAESGRGLHLVASLARDWGWTPARGGKVVWAEIAGVVWAEIAGRERPCDSPGPLA